MILKFVGEALKLFSFMLFMLALAALLSLAVSRCTGNGFGWIDVNTTTTIAGATTTIPVSTIPAEDIPDIYDQYECPSPNGHKLLVCHCQSDDPHYILVSFDSLPGHLGHGDYPVNCDITLIDTPCGLL